MTQGREIEDERRRAQHRDHTAEAFGNALKELFRSASSGNVFELILKTCLTLTGATRGLYVTVANPSAPARVRAAVDVDDYPSAQPSSFITSLCSVALENEGVSACNDLSLWPEQPREGEAFRNCLAAPVVLRNDERVWHADVYQGSGGGSGAGVWSRPDAHTVQYRLYCQVDDTVYTDGVLHQFDVPADMEVRPPTNTW